MKKSLLPRREFIKQGVCGSMTSLGLLNTLIQLRLTGNAVAQTGAPQNYKALVCLFLFGGNDSYNMLIPTASGEYSNYVASRTNLALPSPGSPNGVLPLTTLNTPGRTFGVNPALEFLQSAYNNEDVAFIANAGTLIEPIPNVAAYNSGNYDLPKALFSHNNQQMEWQTSLPQSLSASTGWAGRMADNLNILNDPNGKVPMSVSLNGNNTLQTGTDVVPYVINESGAVGLTDLNTTVANNARNNTTTSFMDQTYRSVLERAYAEESNNSFDAFADFSAALNSSNITTVFSNTGLAKDLEMVAKTIKSAPNLGHERQIFFVGLGGFDHHSSLLAPHTALLKELDGALASFNAAMHEINMDDDVTLFTCSEFGRTMRSNGLGTDHAWGGNQIVMGGAVKGSRIYGDYPSNLLIGTGLDVGTTGRLLPTTSCDLYFAELAKWFGVSSGDLETILPNINNFYSPTSAAPPLGFLL